MKFFSRIVQFIMYGLRFFVRIPLPHLHQGEHLAPTLVAILQRHRKKRILWVSDATLQQLQASQTYQQALVDASIEVILFLDVHPNPHLGDIESAFDIYRTSQCEAIVGFGGGSVMDAAKGVGAMIASKKPLKQLRGLLKVRRRPPLMIMIPTTAGTGSEATVAVVVSDPSTREKYAISDPVLVPSYALLDHFNSKDLPKHLIASTGMDALTHAIEAYLNRFHSPFSKQQAVEAYKTLYHSLEHGFHHPEDRLTRAALLKASYQAGCAFTRDYVGFVHGLAHPLGGFYNIPHGLANAVLLPRVLKAYGRSIEKKLAELYDVASMGTHTKTDEKADAILTWLHHLNHTFCFPSTFEAIQPHDIPSMVQHCFKEVIPFYPVPTYLSRETLHNLYEGLMVR